MQQSNLLAALFRYKAWANDELYALMQTVDATKYPDERHSCIRLLNHVHVVDRIFAAHLTRTKHAYTATNTKETPTLDDLTRACGESDRWYVDFIATLDRQALEERIEFVFTDETNARMSREEMLMHVITHGGYHRGAAGRILSQIGVAPPRDLFTGFLHKTESERRLRA
jgi:uncharacterized damage-inducible protein DinB